MGLSSVPIVAGIMPGALSAWAVQLGNQAVGIEPGAHAAAGSSPAALVMSLIIVLGCFIVALGAFEQQEL
jgi:hypothetical protein